MMPRLELDRLTSPLRTVFDWQLVWVMLGGLSLTSCVETLAPSLLPSSDLPLEIIIDEAATQGDGRLLPDVTCAQCHPRQAEEYARSTMRYGFLSPTFNALELSLNQLSDGAFSHSLGDRAFCSDCHGPRAISEGLEVTSDRSSRSAMTPEQAREGGIGCDLCHSQQTVRKPSEGLIARGSFHKLTVNEPLVPNLFHGDQNHRDESESPSISSSEFCAPCHDVRPSRSDAVTGDQQLLSEDLFSEWRRSPWARADHPLNPLRGQPGITGVHDREEEIESGEVITCQDCHMSLYPWRHFTDEVHYDEAFSGVAPESLTRKAHKLYPVGRSAERGQRSSDDKLISRRVSTHYFTGVSQPLTPFSSSSIFDLSSLTNDGGASSDWVDERSKSSREWLTQWREWVSKESRIDDYGHPMSLPDRREALLKAALTLDLSELPERVSPGDTVRLDAWIENVGAGHQVPAGFSQEREVWVSMALVDQGRSCQSDLDCIDLLEPPLFLDSPNRSCTVHSRTGEVDRALPQDGAWELAARRERSAVCSDEGQCILYRSGYLIDEDGDGRLNDEELRHTLIERDHEAFDERCVISGPDADARLRGVERGLVHFTNALQRVEVNEDGEPVEHPSVSLLAPTAEPYDPMTELTSSVFTQDPRARRSLYPTQRARYEQARYRPAPPGQLGVTRRGVGLTSPTLLTANRAFNGQALAPFEPRLARYEVKLPSGVIGPLRVEASVRFRFFSPRLLYTLIDRHPELLREEMIDEGLHIIDMVSAEHQIDVDP